MIPSSLFAFVAILSSLVASANGGVVQRDGTTYLTPQPTVPLTTPTSTPTSTPMSTPMSTPSSSPTSTRPTTTSSSAPASSFRAMSSSPLLSSGVTVPMSASMTLSMQSGTPTGTPTPTSTGFVNCTGLQMWQAPFAYSAGDRVIYVGQLYTAKQWTYNNAPPTHPDQWAAGGMCIQPINNQANCAGVSAWQSTVAYTAGNRVTYGGHLWAAVQWVQANSPGDASGSWRDLGACA